MVTAVGVGVGVTVVMMMVTAVMVTVMVVMTYPWTFLHSILIATLKIDLLFSFDT